MSRTRHARLTADERAERRSIRRARSIRREHRAPSLALAMLDAAQEV